MKILTYKVVVINSDHPCASDWEVIWTVILVAIAVFTCSEFRTYSSMFDVRTVSVPCSGRNVMQSNSLYLCVSIQYLLVAEYQN